MFINVHHNLTVFILCADVHVHLVSLSLPPKEFPEPSL